MRGSARRLGLFLGASTLSACLGPAPPSDDRGGELRVAVRNDPQSWNRMLAVEAVTEKLRPSCMLPSSA